MDRVLAYSAVDSGFDPCSRKTNDFKICICCFSAKKTALTSESKYWLANSRI